MGAHWKHRGGLKRFVAAVEKYVGPATYAAGDLVADHAKGAIMAGSASGTKTKKHLHVPSLPGQPPNNFTQHLHDNIEVVQENPLKVLVASNAKYSAPLEFGTSKMAPRPFFNPAVAATRKDVTATIRRGVDRAIKEAGK